MVTFRIVAVRRCARFVQTVVLTAERVEETILADIRSLQHQDADQKDDATLRREAEAYFWKVPGLQVLAEILTKLRARAPSWWSPEDLRVFWNATERMRWYRERPDLREQIVTSLTGLSASAARKKTPEFQGGLLDSFLEDGDITIRQFEDSFDPIDLVVYGPSSVIWRKLRERMPWEQESASTQETMAFLIRVFLADKSAVRGVQRKPILSPWELRRAIPGAVWHTRIPLEVRVAIDEARLTRERAGEPFTATHELAIATPEVIAASIPIRELSTLLDLAQTAMGCEAIPENPRRTPTTPPASAIAAVSTSASIKETKSTPPVMTNEKPKAAPTPDPDEVLASISRRAANAAPLSTATREVKPASTTPTLLSKHHTSSGTISRSSWSSTAAGRPWPDDVDEVRERFHRDEPDEQTQPRGATR